MQKSMIHGGPLLIFRFPQDLQLVSQTKFVAHRDALHLHFFFETRMLPFLIISISTFSKLRSEHVVEGLDTRLQSFPGFFPVRMAAVAGVRNHLLRVAKSEGGMADPLVTAEIG